MQTHGGVYLILHVGFLSNQQWSFLSQTFPSGVFKFELWPVNKSISQYITYDASSVNDIRVLERLIPPRKAIDCLLSCGTGTTKENSRVDTSKSLLRQTNKAYLHHEPSAHFQGPQMDRWFKDRGQDEVTTI